MTATTEFVVPRSMPMIFSSAMFPSPFPSVTGRSPWLLPAVRRPEIHLVSLFPAPAVPARGFVSSCSSF
jgi:hypothetical protein